MASVIEVFNPHRVKLPDNFPQITVEHRRDEPNARDKYRVIVDVEISDAMNMTNKNALNQALSVAGANIANLYMHFLRDEEG